MRECGRTCGRVWEVGGCEDVRERQGGGRRLGEEGGREGRRGGRERGTTTKVEGGGGEKVERREEGRVEGREVEGGRKVGRELGEREREGGKGMGWRRKGWRKGCHGATEGGREKDGRTEGGGRRPDLSRLLFKPSTCPGQLSECSYQSSLGGTCQRRCRRPRLLDQRMHSCTDSFGKWLPRAGSQIHVEWGLTGHPKHRPGSCSRERLLQSGRFLEFDGA
jgi:hypothetical protein